MPDDGREKANNGIRRIVILGTSGSGKSTIATELAQRIGAQHIELDSLYHGPNWTPVPIDQFQVNVDKLTSGGAWIVDGNYIDAVSEVLWTRADMIIWLDIPLCVILPRIFRRSVTRVIRGTELWSGNRERLSSLIGRDNVLMWAIRSHQRHRNELPRRLSSLEFAGVKVVRLRSGNEVSRWLLDQTV